MKPSQLRILNQYGRVVGRGVVVVGADGCTGDVALDDMPEPMRRVFEDFEVIVNEQVFSRLDEVEDRIAELGLTAEIDGVRCAVTDVQILPNAGKVSFQLEQPSPLRSGR